MRLGVGTGLRPGFEVGLGSGLERRSQGGRVEVGVCDRARELGVRLRVVAAASPKHPCLIPHPGPLKPW